MAANFNEIASFIWSVADLLRGDYKQSDYGKVILPFTLLRRMDCVLEPTKEAVLAEFKVRKKQGVDLTPFLTKKAVQSFFNTSPFTFKKFQGDSDLKANLTSYVNALSENARDIFERYEFFKQIEKLDDCNLLFLIVQKFAAIDLHPNKLSNSDMGLVFEELIRKFAELSNETAGEHYTPREVIRLMVDLLFTTDDDALTKTGVVRTIYDPCAGTGGMLSIAGEHLEGLNPKARLVMHGQELNAESYAICKADMLIKGQNVSNIVFGNTLSEDGHSTKQFDYMLSNPPYGVEWKKVEKAVRDEHNVKGYAGRFGPGLPRVSDGSLLFLMHLLSKMRPYEKNKDAGGSRIGIVLNGSPLFTGGAGSGESEIRKWIIENDWLEAIVALPTDMFYNTGISTYVWILTNRKAKDRKGKVQLINGAEFYKKMRKSLGSKRKELGEDDITSIVEIHGRNENLRYVKVVTADGKSKEKVQREGQPIPEAPEGGTVESFMVSKIFDNHDFGYSTITVERPLLNEKGKVEKDKQGKPKPDSKLRDTENVPLKDDIQVYFKREVLPHVPDAWIDEEKTKVGYEIPFNRHFYQYVAPRPLEIIDAELKAVSLEIMDLLQEVVE